MATFEKIATVDVGVLGAADITFSSIPSTFTDLCVKMSLRSAVLGSSQDDLNVTFNGSGSSYTWRNLLGAGSGTPISQNGSTAYIRMSASTPNAGTTANTFGNSEIYIPNYTSSANKSVSIDMVSEQNTTSTYMGLVAGLWSNSAAITSIALTGASGNLSQYSSATLYGIKKA
jgi:hypothetical protein